MNRHRIECTECEEGKLYKSRHGGNDPDVWFAGCCEECDGAGNCYVDDEECLIAEGSIKTYLNEPRWFAYPSNEECLRTRDRQFRAEADGLVAYGRSEEGAVLELLAKADDRDFEDANAAEAA